MPVSQEFIDFEAAADLLITSLVRGKPIRGLVTLIHVASYMVRLKDPEKKDNYRNLGSKKSGYLIPLFKETNSQFIGATAYDVLGVWGADEEHGEIAKHLFAYANFCEMAPSVHQGNLCEFTKENKVSLTWKSEVYAEYEAKDVTISYLFNPIVLHNELWMRDWFWDKSINPQLMGDLEIFSVLEELTEIFHGCYYEISTLSDKAIQEASGVTMPSFHRFRAACMALAEFHILLFDAMDKRSSENEEIGNDAKYFAEMLDWLVPCWPIGYINKLLAKLAKISEKEVVGLMDTYSFSTKQKFAKAEGFCPPFIISDENYIFSPSSAQYYMSSRNIAYSCLQKHSDHFNKNVSSHLEPRLLDIAVNIFGLMKGLEIKRNIIWENGEIDLIVYRELDKAILLIEAKAAVVAEGARMVRNTESRIQVGLDQIAKFKALSSKKKAMILSNALGKNVADAEHVYVVLTWAGFGTESVWSKFKEITPVNITMLAYLVSSLPELKLNEFNKSCAQLIDEIVAAAKPSWETVEVKMGELSLSYPNLNIDLKALLKYQVAPHKLLHPRSVFNYNQS